MELENFFDSLNAGISLEEQAEFERKKARKYDIKILPDDEEHFSESQQRVLDMTLSVISSLSYKIAANLPIRNSPENVKNYKFLMQNLADTRFWGAMSDLDGYVVKPWRSASYSVEDRKRIELSRPKSQRWALNEFNNIELEKILNVIVNQAIFSPRETSWPGTKRGHSILYEDIVSQKDSIFHNSITPELETRIINGAFWENLSEANPYWDSGTHSYLIDEILNVHFDKLSTSFAKKGFRFLKEPEKDFYRKENQEIPDKLDNIYLSYLTEPALDNYARFVENIDDAKALPEDNIVTLLKPYVSAILIFDDFGPYYDGNEVEYNSIDYANPGGHKKGLYTDKLQVPVLQKYMKKNSGLQTYFAKELEDILNGEYTETDFETRREIVENAINSVPNQYKISTPPQKNDSHYSIKISD